MKTLNRKYPWILLAAILALSCENPLGGGLGEAPDITPPEITITQPPTNGETFRTKDAASLLLAGTWDDNQAYKAPTIRVRWIEGNLIQNATVSGKTWSLDILQAFDLGSLSSGSQNFLVTITDGSGNTNYATRHILIDNGDVFVTDVTSLSPNGWYKASQTIPLRVSFNRAVAVTGSPRIPLNAGSGAFAVYASGSGTNVLTFNYVIQAGDMSADLDSTAASLIDLNGGTIKDNVDNTIDAVLNLPTAGSPGSLGHNKDIRVDTQAPTVSGVSSSQSDGYYVAGASVLIQITFSEPVFVSGTPRLLLNTTPARYAVYQSGTSTASLTFAYTVQAGDSAADLDYASTAALELNGGTIEDAATNAAVLTLVPPGQPGSLGHAKNLVIDAQPPVAPGISGVTAGNYNTTQSFTLTGIETGATAHYSLDGGATWNTYTSTVSLTTSGTYKIRARQQDAAGNFSPMSSEITVVLALTQPSVASAVSTTLNGAYKATQQVSIVVTFTAPVTVTGTPRIQLNTTPTAYALYTAGTGTAALTFTYTVGAGQNTPRLDYASTTALELNGGTIKDAFGFDAFLTLPTANFLGNKFIEIDTTAPTVNTVGSTTPDGFYRQGTSVLVQITFSEPVFVTGSPELALNAGTGSKAVYMSGAGTDTLTLLYVVGASHNSAKLNYPATTSLTGTIADAAGNAANLTLPAPASSGLNSKNLVIDTTPPVAPTVSGITAGAFGSHQTFTVSGESGATLEYTINGGATWSTYSTPVTLTDGLYTVLARQIDQAGNQGPATSPIVLSIDTVAPVITNVTSDNPNGSYIAGQHVDIKVEFSKVVTVTGGTPTLALDTTPARSASYLSGSGTNSLVFRYTVQAGDSANDLNYVATTSLALNTAQIRDALNVNANVTLPSPSGTGSLGTNKNIVIDAVAPTVTSRAPAHNAINVAASSNIVLTFSEPVYRESGTLSIRRVHNRIPVVLSVDERNFWRSKFTGSELANFDASYELTTNGTNGSGVPNTTGVYVLVFSKDPTDAALLAQFDTAGYNRIDIDVQSSRVTGHGTNTITIDPVEDLPIGTHWYVEIPPTAFRDAAGNFFAGFSGPSAYAFVTGPVAPPIVRVHKQNGNGASQPTQTGVKLYTPTEGAEVRYLVSETSGGTTVWNPTVPASPGDPTASSTLYSTPLTVGTTDPNRGYIWRARARAFGAGASAGLTQSAVVEEIAFKTVLQTTKLPDAPSDRIYFLGSSNAGGPTTTPGHPLSWEIGPVPASVPPYARLAHHYGGNVWGWITWAIVVDTQFKAVQGNATTINGWMSDPNRNVKAGGYSPQSW